MKQNWTQKLFMSFFVLIFGVLSCHSALAGGGKIRCDSLFETKKVKQIEKLNSYDLDINRRNLKAEGLKGAANKGSVQESLADEILAYASEIFNGVDLEVDYFGKTASRGSVASGQIRNQAIALNYKKSELFRKLRGTTENLYSADKLDRREKAVAILYALAYGTKMSCESFDYRIFKRLVEISGIDLNEAKELTRRYLKSRFNTGSDIFKTIPDFEFYLVTEALFEAQAYESKANLQKVFKLQKFNSDRLNVEKLLLISSNLTLELNGLSGGQAEQVSSKLILPVREFGIRVYELAISGLNTSEKASLPFKLNGNHYTLMLNLKNRKFNPVWSKTKAPKLDEMWRDAKMAGLILIGELQEGSYWLESEYKEYFQSQGFRFRPPRVVALKKDILDLIKKGSIDYVVTENSGSEISSWLRLTEGMRTSKNGEESILIASSLSFQDIVQAKKKNLGIRVIRTDSLNPIEIIPEIMFERKRNGITTELIYISSECNSAYCLSEIARRTSSPHLTYIAPNTIAETFTNADDSALKRLLHGLRTGQNYSEIWRQMRQIEKERQKAILADPRDWLDEYEKENLYMLPPYRNTVFGTLSKSINELSAFVVDEESNIIPLTIETF